MRWPLVSRRRYEALEADRERIRGERDQFLKDRDSFKYAAESASEKYTDTAIVNECITEDLAKAREELAELKAQLSDSAATYWKAEAKREKKRGDRLQKQYDDAVGLKPGGIEDSRPWQPGYQAPKPDGVTS
jgi:chromosome segregation ATPase